MEKTKLIFLGAGGHARVLASTVESTAAELVAVFDPDPTKKDLDGVENMGDYKADVHPEAKLLIAIGDNSVCQLGIEFETRKFVVVAPPQNALKTTHPFSS